MAAGGAFFVVTFVEAGAQGYQTILILALAFASSPFLRWRQLSCAYAALASHVETRLNRCSFHGAPSWPSARRWSCSLLKNASQSCCAFELLRRTKISEKKISKENMKNNWRSRNKNEKIKHKRATDAGDWTPGTLRCNSTVRKGEPARKDCVFGWPPPCNDTLSRVNELSTPRLSSNQR